MTSTVAQRSAASSAMLAASQKGRALMGGTTAMRAAGETYLPKFERESAKAYDTRLKASWLFNGYRKTVKDMTGRVFSKSVELADDAPDALREWCDNIDMEGRDLSTFARQVFEDVIGGCGISYIMVDAPRREGTVTRFQAQRQNLRPFLVHLRVEDVLGWRTETVDNVTRLVQLRIAETVKEADPKDEFKDVAVEQIRVLDLIGGKVQTRIFRKGQNKDWGVVDEFTTDLDQIAVIPVYGARTGFFTAEPMLDDLADINIAHWQSQSDQRNILHYARVPILFGAGVNESEIVIGSNSAVMAETPDAKLQWVEHSGAAIDAGRQDLKDLEFQMETFGLQLLTARPGAQSATGEALDANKETSILAMTADQLQDALEQALAVMARLGGVDAQPSVVINKDFGVTMMTAQDITALLSAVTTGNLSRQTFIEELARRGVIRSDVTPEDEYDRIEADQLPPDNIAAA